MLNEKKADFIANGMSHDMLVHVFKEVYQALCTEFKENEEAHKKLSMQIHKIQPRITYFKRLTETAHIPTQGSTEAAGWDLYADLQDIESITIEPGDTVMIHTGIAMALPESTFGAIYARSGLASKKGLAPANKVGVVDADYRGEVMVALHNHSHFTQTIEAGERIAQLVIQPYIKADFIELDELDNTTRGEGGFGSTGAK